MEKTETVEAVELEVLEAKEQWNPERLRSWTRTVAFLICLITVCVLSFALKKDPQMFILGHLTGLLSAIGIFYFKKSED